LIVKLTKLEVVFTDTRFTLFSYLFLQYGVDIQNYLHEGKRSCCFGTTSNERKMYTFNLLASKARLIPKQCSTNAWCVDSAKKSCLYKYRSGCVCKWLKEQLVLLN